MANAHKMTPNISTWLISRDYFEEKEKKRKSYSKEEVLYGANSSKLSTSVGNLQCVQKCVFDYYLVNHNYSYYSLAQKINTNNNNMK